MRVLVVCVALWLTACVQPGPAARQPLPPLSFDSPPQALLQAAMQGVPAGTAVAAVWRDGHLHMAGVRDGEPLPDHELTGARAPLFEIGSISKVFTGVLLAQAVERGELALDDTLALRLQGEVTFQSPHMAAITLRQLATHTACLPRMPANFGGGTRADPYRAYDRAQLWRALADQALPRTGPCDALYSNYGFAVLGELISVRLGKPWTQLVAERITAPLGLTDTLRDLGDQAARLAPAYVGRSPASPWQMLAFAGAGSLRASAADLVRFGRALAAGRQGPLGVAAERVATPLAWLDGDIGLALMLRGPPQRRTWLHGGTTGGYRALLMVAPDTGQVLVVLASNGRASTQVVQRAVLASRHPVAGGPTVAPDPSTLAAYAGVYRGDGGEVLTLVAQDGALWARPPGLGFEALRPLGGDAFLLFEYTRLQFVRTDGRVQGLHTAGGGVERELRRTDLPPPAVARQPAHQLQPYVGRYKGEGLDFSVQQLDGVLRVRLNDQPRLPVFPLPGQADRFAYDVVAAELQFERQADGTVRSLVLHQHGRRLSVPRID